MTTKTVSPSAPLVSICLPTYNREDLLDLCLERLAELNRVGIDYEVIVSDNCSTDRTPEIVRKHGAAIKRLTYLRMKSNKGPLLNWHNAIRHATGEFVIYLGDDDRLLPEALAEHLQVMRDRPELVATYADWISFDDNREVEVHRYYNFLDGRLEFGPADHAAALDFLLGNQVLPETGLLRRVNLLKALPFVKVGYPYLQYLFHMLRQGTIAFDKKPFYVENRVVKKHLDRGNWQGMGLWLVNDEMRTSAELITLRFFQDAGFPTVPLETRAQMREIIESRLLQRFKFEALVAAHAGNWILASELHRRWTLWRGDTSPLDFQDEVNEIIVPAALQAVRETLDAESDANAVVFHGFLTNTIPDLFGRMYPTVAIERDDKAAWTALQRGERKFLHVVKTEADLAGSPHHGNVLLFDNLVDLYRTATGQFVLTNL